MSEQGRSPEDVRREIAATRDELADTAAALAAKADVKERARERVDEVKDDVRSRVGSVKESVADKAGELRDKVAPGTDDRPAPAAPTAGTAGMAGGLPRTPAAGPAPAGGEPASGAASAAHAAGDAASSAARQVRSHPLPAAAIAAALLGFVLGYLAARR